MKLFEQRISSYVDRGNQLVAQGKTKEAMELMEKGFDVYTQKIIKVLSPYAKADAGMIALILRHLANEIEAKNEGAAQFREGMEKIVKFPPLTETAQDKRPNRR